MDALSARAFNLSYLRERFNCFSRHANSVLLLNKTKNPHIGFIISDVAVGFSDKLLYFDLSKRINHKVQDTFGIKINDAFLESPGFLCFYPLSKDRCLLSYNRHTYSINGGNHTISISCKQDVRDINRCLLETGKEIEGYFKNIYYDPCVDFSYNDHVLKGSNFLEGDISIGMPIKHIIPPAFSFLPVQRKMKDLQTQLYKRTNSKNNFHAYQREVHRKLPALEENNFRFSKECFLAVNYSRIIDLFPELFLQPNLY